MSFITVAVIAGTGAVIGGTASYLGAKEQTKASKKAAEMSLTASQDANALQREFFNTARADTAPWREAGKGSLNVLADYMGIPMEGQTPSAKFGYLNKPFDINQWQDPGYDFRLRQGIRALDRSAAAQGNLFSGAQGKALTQYGQDYGSNEFANAYNRWTSGNDTLYNRLAGLSGTGQAATRDIGQWGINMAGNIGQNMITGANMAGQNYQNAATARASGYAGVANAANQGAGNYLFYNLMRTPSQGVMFNPYRQSTGAWDSGGIHG